MNYSQNVTIDIKKLFLSNSRSSPLADIFNLYLIVPMGISGSLFNLICLIILVQKPFRNIGLFKYVIVYTASCLITALSQIFFFCFSNSLLYEVSLSYIGRIYKCYITASFVTTFFFFFSNLLDIFINLERTINFSSKYQNFKQISPYKICLIGFIACLIINIPNNMAQELVSTQDLYIKLRYCVETSFSKTTYGKVLLYVSFMIQGPLLLVLVIITNISSMISFKSFLKRKSKVTVQVILTESQLKKQKWKEKTERRLLFMTFYLTLFSFVILLVQFVAQLVIFLLLHNFSNEMGGWFIFLFAFVIALKQLSNIFFYYHFNENFKKSILNCQLRTKKLIQ